MLAGLVAKTKSVNCAILYDHDMVEHGQFVSNCCFLNLVVSACYDEVSSIEWLMPLWSIAVCSVKSFETFVVHVTLPAAANSLDHTSHKNPNVAQCCQYKLSSCAGFGMQQILA